jgi:hypothetical protein
VLVAPMIKQAHEMLDQSLSQQQVAERLAAKL